MKTINRNEYVYLLPEEFVMAENYISFQYEKLYFFTNVEKANNSLVSLTADIIDTTESHIREESVEIGRIIAMMDNDLITPRDIIDNELIRKDDYRYNGEHNKVYYNTQDRLHVMHYPYKGIISSSNAKTKHTIFAGTEDSLIEMSRMALKMTLISYNRHQGFYALHSAAVTLGDKVLLILGGSHASKTTVFMNLVAHSYLPVNDDMVFLKWKEESMSITSYRVLPSVRRKSLKYIANADHLSIEEAQNSSFDEFYCDVWKNLGINGNVLHGKSIAAILIPEYGHNSFKCYPASRNLVQQRIIKSLAGFQKLVATEGLLHLFNGLMGIPAFKIELSEDMTDFAHVISKYLREEGIL